jgi:hypothetical protein
MPVDLSEFEGLSNPKKRQCLLGVALGSVGDERAALEAGRGGPCVRRRRGGLVEAPRAGRKHVSGGASPQRPLQLQWLTSASSRSSPR